MKNSIYDYKDYKVYLRDALIARAESPLTWASLPARHCETRFFRPWG